MTTYNIKIDDNYHYMDESERRDGGIYDTPEKAMEECERITTQSLNELYEEGMDPIKLSSRWSLFGDDPFISGDDGSVPFSARTFVTEELCKQVIQNRYDMSLQLKAQIFAIKAHCNQKYGIYPYGVHLNFVYHFALKYLDLIEASKKDIVLAACWLHDTIEDCEEVTVEIINNEFGKEVANIVYAVTNQNGQYNLGALQANSLAYFVKLCDRLANVFFLTVNFDEQLSKKYKDQLPEISQHCPQEFVDIIREIESTFTLIESQNID
jgi:hypothetical protein